MSLAPERETHLIIGCVLNGNPTFLYNKQSNDHLVRKDGVLFRMPHPEQNVGYARFVGLSLTTLPEMRVLYEECPDSMNLEEYEVVETGISFNGNTLHNCFFTS